MNEDTKFPEACHHSESAPETHIAEDVDDWFRACMEDYPINYMITQDRWVEEAEDWYEKWFSQFKEDE